jgi:acyl-CoA thioester hydrolase
VTEAPSLPVASAGAFDGRRHLLAVRVYYEDTDLSGVVYHAGYVRFFERGRSDSLRCAGVHHAELLAGDPPLAFAVTKLAIAFKAPARIDDSLVVETRFLAAAGVRMQIDQRIWRGDVLLVEASVEAVCIDLQGRPKRLPKAVQEKLAPFVALSAPAD